MQLTTERLKQIIKEELEALVNETGTEEETETVSNDVNEVDAEIASLEQQLAEAKKKAAKMSAAGKAKVKDVYKGAQSHKMSPMSGKRHDTKKGK